MTQSADDWDDLADLWLTRRSQVLWRRHSDAVNSRLVREWLPGRVGRVLKTDLFDEAVSGGILPALADRADEVVGIDVSPAVVEAAAARHDRLGAQLADVRALPFPDGSFDAVLSNSTLDHFGSLAEIVTGLRELHRVLRPRGTLVVTLDNPWNPLMALSKAVPRAWLNETWNRYAPGLGKVGILPYHVGVTMSAPALVRTLAGIGFTVEETTAVMHAPRLPAVLIGSVLERRAGKVTQERFLELLRRCESLRERRTCLVTGTFVAVRAVRPQESPCASSNDGPVASSTQ
jgi:SAM-dependent methyltransferase